MNRVRIGILLLSLLLPSVLLPFVAILFANIPETKQIMINFAVSTVFAYVMMFFAGRVAWKAPRTVLVMLFVSFWPLAAAFFGTLIANLIYFG